MDTVIMWCGFLGAWLLVAGPLYQASLELQEEEFRRHDLRAVHARVQQPPEPVSRWWWLVPPVAYVLRRRRSSQWRQSMIDVMSTEEVEQLVHYLNLATGWLYVGLGGLLLALKESWELVEREGWWHGTFWLGGPVMSLLCALNVALRIGRSRSMVNRSQS